MKIKYSQIFSNALKLWPYLSNKKKFQLKIYAFVTILSGFADLISIGSVIPFVMVLIEPNKLMEFIFFTKLFKYLNLTSISEIKFFLCIAFSLAVILSGFIKILLSWFQSRLSYGVAADLGNNVFSSALWKSYSYHLQINSNEVVSNIANKANIVADNVIHPMLSFLLAFVTTFAISFILFLINPLVTFTIFFLTFSSYILISILVKNQIAAYSKNINKNFDSVMKIVKEGLDGIRYIILTSSQKIFISLHQKYEVSLRNSQGNISFLSLFPRAIIETFALLIFAWVVYIFFGTFENSFNLIYFLSAMVMSFQRLLPVVQQAYFGWIKLSGANEIILDTLDRLEDVEDLKIKQSNNLQPKIDYNREINLENLSFSYEKNNLAVLDKINLRIPKSSKVGITGVSGSGKSTLLDIIMGFLKADKGLIKVDGKSIEFEKNVSNWQSNISLVPQRLYLSDSSILSNIAFGIEEKKIDFNKIKEVIKIAQLEEFINSLDEKINYRVGEDGKNLSFGQKQRIAIARALYRESDLLVIDEGTSALDKETQSRIINSLNILKNNPTIIMVAHRIEILENFDVIYELKNAHLKKIFSK